MVEARIDSKRFGREFARYLAICRVPDTIVGLQEKEAAMDRFTQRTGVGKDFAGRIRGSVSNARDFRKPTMRPLLSALEYRKGVL